VDNRLYEDICGFTYVYAKIYLKSVGLWDRNKDYDGYTIVETARRHRAKQFGIERQSDE